MVAGMTVTIATGLFLAGAIGQDLKTRKIKNIYNVSGVLAAAVLRLFEGAGIRTVAGGMAVGFGAGFVLYLLGAVKAGDSKVMWALGTFLGVKRFWNMLVWSVLAGGAGGVIVLLFKKDGRKRLARLREYGKRLLYTRRYCRYEAEDKWEFPFTVCMGAGYLVSLAVRGIEGMG